MAKHIAYRVEVEITAPLSDYPDDPDYPTLEYASSSQTKRELEKSILACLRRLEPECTNVEVMDFTVEDDGLHGADCRCETCQMERARDTAEEHRHD